MEYKCGTLLLNQMCVGYMNPNTKDHNIFLKIKINKNIQSVTPLFQSDTHKKRKKHKAGIRCFQLRSAMYIKPCDLSL